MMIQIYSAFVETPDEYQQSVYPRRFLHLLELRYMNVWYPILFSGMQ